VPAIEYECLFDEEVVGGFDMVGMDKDGFPLLQTMDGEAKNVKGKYFLVRRDKATPVPEDFVVPTKQLLSEMMEAVNKVRASVSRAPRESRLPCPDPFRLHVHASVLLLRQPLQRGVLGVEHAVGGWLCVVFPGPGGWAQIHTHARTHHGSHAMQ
jgi:hypothetical protein